MHFEWCIQQECISNVIQLPETSKPRTNIEIRSYSIVIIDKGITGNLQIQTSAPKDKNN